MPTNRLSKVLAATGLASRRACEDIIRAGRVEVNGTVVLIPQHPVDPEVDRVKVDGRVATVETRKVYYLLNKPAGFICTNERPKNGRIVLDLFPKTHLRLFTVGRLDRDTTGLIIVTNDGQFAHQIIHPSSGISKEYLLKVSEELDEERLERLREGCIVDDVFVKPLNVRKVRRGTVRISVAEGRKHEVRILAEYAGLTLQSLQRIRLGSLVLGEMPEGAYRDLTQTERRELLAAAIAGRAKPRKRTLIRDRMKLSPGQRARLRSESREAHEESHMDENIQEHTQEEDSVEMTPVCEMAAAPAIDWEEVEMPQEGTPAPAKEREATEERPARAPRAEGREDRPYRENRGSFGDRRGPPGASRPRSFDDRGPRPSFGDRAPGRSDDRAPRQGFGGAPGEDRGPPRERRSFDGPREGYAPRPYQDRGPPRGDRPSYDRGPPRGDRPSYDRGPPRGDRPFQDRGPPREGGFAPRPYQDRGPPRGDRPFQDRGPPREGFAPRRFDDRGPPRGDRPFQDRGPPREGGFAPRPYQDRGPPRGDRPFQDRGPPRGDRPSYDRGPPRGDRPFNNDRPPFREGGNWGGPRPERPAFGGGQRPERGGFSREGGGFRPGGSRPPFGGRSEGGSFDRRSPRPEGTRSESDQGAEGQPRPRFWQPEE
ncbi:MAG: pseudouridine synthase [Chlamydiia bacterium]